jgi:hypothetical protein
MEATQERIDTNLKDLQEDIKTSQAEMRPMADAWMTNIMNAPPKKRQPPAKK